MPYPWGDRIEATLGNFGLWVQITLAIIAFRILMWLVISAVRRGLTSRDPERNGSRHYALRKPRINWSNGTDHTGGSLERLNDAPSDGEIGDQQFDEALYRRLSLRRAALRS